ncbi:MAG: NAD-dependent epimerase/dehydratase family protein [Muribaculaceae bacterium]|nr:NAD-dependent epimerase/dehydratase family protein [Muribaculaceae bacterium]
MKEKMLVTGGSGFIGSHIVGELRRLYDVTLCGRAAENDVRADLTTDVPRLPEHYDIVFHAAGKAHTYPYTPVEQQEYFDVNFQGTKNLCSALEAVGVPRSFIYLSTVAVYGCDSGEDIDESWPLNGSSPYALSKIAAERYLTDWCKAHGVILSIIRAPLIAGPNPPGNLGAMIAGIRTGRYLRIGGSKARKSMLMVQDLVLLIAMLADRGGIYNVSDDTQPTVASIEETIARQLGGRRIVAVPYAVAAVLARIGDLLGHRSPFNTFKLKKLTATLTFSNARAKADLGWSPTSVPDNFKIR